MVINSGAIFCDSAQEVFCLFFKIDVVSFRSVLMALNISLIFTTGTQFLRGIAITNYVAG